MAGKRSGFVKGSYGKPLRRSVYRRVRRQTGKMTPAKTPFPARKTCNLIYAETGQLLDSEAGGLVEQKYRSNSLYDPDLTGVGGQPYYFDQICSDTAPYYRYRVTGVTVDIKIRGDGSSTGVFGLGAYSVNDVESIANLVEQGGITVNIDKDGHAKPIHKYYDIWKIAGRTKGSIMDDDEFGASYNTNPSQCPILHLMAQSDNSAVASMHIYFDIKLTYHCIFSAINEVSRS